MTRHNVGFMVIDQLAKELEISLKAVSSLEGEVGKSGDVVLLKPTTYMNLSGESITKVMRYYKVEELLVVADDVHLDFTALRMREKGGSGGHNGLTNIIHFLGEDFPRLRVGVGAPGNLELSDYVLANFSEGEQNVLFQVIEQATQVCKTWLKSGFQDAAMIAANYVG